jgi:hypothetical protein
MTPTSESFSTLNPLPKPITGSKTKRVQEVGTMAAHHANLTRSRGHESNPPLFDTFWNFAGYEITDSN